jgi:hypothetical protein
VRNFKHTKNEYRRNTRQNLVHGNIPFEIDSGMRDIPEEGKKKKFGTSGYADKKPVPSKDLSLIFCDRAVVLNVPL